MQQAALDLVRVLDERQRAAVQFDLDDSRTRTDWGYFPRAFHGLPLGAMDTKQQKLTHTLLSSALSLHAYAKVTTIVALDNVLDVIEGRIAPHVRDPARYFLSIYGDPSAPPWAFQFEGHHVSLNLTLGEQSLLSATPLFLGSNPAEVEHAGSAIVRVCGEEEDAGRDLLLSLDSDQRAEAIICTEAPPDFVLANIPRVGEKHAPGESPLPLPQAQAAFSSFPRAHKQALTFDRSHPAGLAAAAMTPSQRERFDALLSVYIERLPEDLASIERAKMAPGRDELHFAWAGSEHRREGHYYRIQGPSLLIEYDNTQDGANHIHAVWRDPEGDFGGPLLSTHYGDAHPDPRP